MIVVSAFMCMIVALFQFRVRPDLDVSVAFLHETFCKSSGALSTLAVHNDFPVGIIDENASLNAASDCSL